MTSVNNGPSSAVTSNSQSAETSQIMTGLFADLPTASRHAPLRGNFAVAYTTDQGPVYSNGTNWIPYTSAAAGFANLIAQAILDANPDGTPLRDVMALAPVITSGAASSMAGNVRAFPFKYYGTTAYTPLGVVTFTGGLPTFDNVTTNYALSSFSGMTQAFEFEVSGRYIELQFAVSTSNTFFVRVDGYYESVTPITETNAFRKYDFGSDKLRRVEIIAAGANVGSFFPEGVIIGSTASIGKTTARGPLTILVGDSFVGAPYSIYAGFCAASNWNNVWASGVGGSGYIQTNGNTVPTFGMRLQHDVIQYNPKIVGFIGSINDSGFTYAQVYAAALSLYQRTRAALPGAVIFAAPTSNLQADAMDTATWETHRARKDAAAAAGILWVDLLEQYTSLPPLTGVAQFGTLNGGTTVDLTYAASTPSWGSNWGYALPGQVFEIGSGANRRRYTILNVANNAGYANATISGNFGEAYPALSPITLVGPHYLVGTGRVGSTTGVGNRDLVISNDNTHPSNFGYDLIGVLTWQELKRAVAAKLSAARPA